MTPLLIPLAQGFAAGAWALVAVYFWRDVWLVITRKATPMSVFGALWAATGAVQVGFTVRWYLFYHAVATMGPAERALWAGLYLASGAIACQLLIYAALHYRRKVA